jgi:hypothetical protein
VHLLINQQPTNRQAKTMISKKEYNRTRISEERFQSYQQRDTIEAPSRFNNLLERIFETDEIEDIAGELHEILKTILIHLRNPTRESLYETALYRDADGGSELHFWMQAIDAEGFTADQLASIAFNVYCNLADLMD